MRKCSRRELLQTGQKFEAASGADQLEAGAGLASALASLEPFFRPQTNLGLTTTSDSTTTNPIN